MLIKIDTRHCNTCGQDKPKEDFYSYKYQCKSCHHSYQTTERKKKYSSDWYKRRKQKDPQLFLWKTAKHRAKFDYNNMEFTIEVKDSKIPETCPYFNTALIPLDKKWAPSLDRIDSSRGYVPDNIQVVSRLANQLKNCASEEELIRFAKGVLAVHQGGNGCAD